MTKAGNSRTLFALAVLLAVLFLLCGCQARETNLALQMSDQAQQATQQKLAQDIAPIVVHLPPEMQQAVKQAIDDACQLLTASREAIAPAIALTQGNEPAPESRTTVEQAYSHTASFVRAAAIQTGRAHIETEGYLSYVRFASMAANWGQALATDWLSMLLLGGGGLGLGGGLIAKGITAYRSVKKAASDAVAFGNDMYAANTEDEAQAVIKKHKQHQKDNGTNEMIKQLGAMSVATPGA